LLADRLRVASEKIFLGFNGVGYARLDFRVNAENEIYFLEINFTCSVFYKDGYEGSADFILKYDGIGQKGFLELMIKEARARYTRSQRPFTMRGNAIAGFGIYANRNIVKGEKIFTGEGRAQRIITRRFVEKNWNEDEQLHFRRYAYPVSDELFILWDDDPSEWAPQNHSCDPNSFFEGLDVIAARDIRASEELTLDYTLFLDENMEPFQCRCGAKNCRGLLMGMPGNSLTKRENQLRTHIISDLHGSKN
jgi:D-alanine-D-alanine ligase